MPMMVKPADVRTPDLDRESNSRSKVVVRWVGRLVAATVILTSAAAICVAVLIPRLGGATPYEVLTGSMQPGLPPGTLIVVKPVTEPSQIGVGSIVTYQLRSGEPTVVTHRITEVLNGLDGKITYITQGDANSIPDDAAVRPEQIRGQLWYAVPHLGRANDLISGEQRRLGVVLVASLLLGYAAVMLTQAAVGLRHRGEGEPA